MNNTEILSIYEVLFYAYNINEIKDSNNGLCYLDYDINHDFLIDSTIDGIAVALSIKREKDSSKPQHGIRRKLALTIIDTTMRCEVHKETLWVNFQKDTYDNTWLFDFPLKTTDLRAGHNYKLVVIEEKTARVLGEYVFHLLDKERLGEPSEWYYVYEAGISHCLTNKLYKAIFDKNSFYYITFFVQYALGQNPPAIMPELEFSLYAPDGSREKHCFIEPKCINFIEKLYITVR